MMADLRDVLPEESNEQNQRLLRDLRRLYHPEAGKAERLAHGRHRLLAMPDGSSDKSRPYMRRARSAPGNGEATRTPVRGAGLWRHRLSMAAAVVLVTVLVGSLLLVLRSSKGAQGNLSSSPKQTGGLGRISTLHMIDAMAGWALSAQGILRTTDGGLSWQNVSPPDSSFPPGSIAAFRTASLAWVGAPETSAPTAQLWSTTPGANAPTARIWGTTDGGKSWQSSRIQATSLKQLTFVDAQHGWILVGTGAAGETAEAVSVLRSTDGGKTWQSVSSALVGDTTPRGQLPYGGQKSGIAFLDASTGWVTGTVPTAHLAWLYITHDGGLTWNQQTLSMPADVPSGGQLSITAPTFFSRTDGILPVTFSDLLTGSAMATTIYWTHDAGTTWQHTTSIPFVSGTVDFLDMQHGWATDGTVLYRTSDGGQHWAKLSPKANFTHITCLNFVSSTVGRALRKQNENATILETTRDGGLTWAPIS